MKTPSEYWSQRKAHLPQVQLRAQLRKELKLGSYWRMPLPKVFTPETLTIEDCQQYSLRIFERKSHPHTEQMCNGYREKIISNAKRLKTLKYQSPTYTRAYNSIQMMLPCLLKAQYTLQVDKYLDNVYQHKYYSMANGSVYGPYSSMNSINAIAAGVVKPSNYKQLKTEPAKARLHEWE